MTVLRTVYLSHLRPILVINKLDRLITELKLSPTEAYHHMQRIIEDVNAVVGSFYSSERMEEDYKRRDRQDLPDAAPEEDYEERDDASLYFDPAMGNVLFASAIDGWAFRISRFAQLYSTKLGMSEKVLGKVLWGDWFLDMKTKRVMNRKKMEQSGKKLKPLFVQFILDNIWAAYDAVVLNKYGFSFPQSLEKHRKANLRSLRFFPQQSGQSRQDCRNSRHESTTARFTSERHSQPTPHDLLSMAPSRPFRIPRHSRQDPRPRFRPILPYSSHAPSRDRSPRR